MATINISTITSGSLTGAGVFDQIMTAMQIRLEEEFNQGRIIGDDYANVYLGAMTASMQQAVSFVLGKQTAEAQAELLEAQALEVGANTLKVNAEELLTRHRIVNEEAQRSDSVTDVDGTTITVTGLIGKQKELIASQLAESVLKQANITVDTANKTKEGTILVGQVSKLAAEELLIKHNIVNTAAQRSDTVIDVDGTSKVVSGVIGKQKVLYQAQTDGFARDAEQKLAKIYVDTWNVRRTTDNGLSAAGTGLEDAYIASVLTKAKHGVGL